MNKFINKIYETQRIECDEEKSSRYESINRISKENTHREFWDNNAAQLVGVPKQCLIGLYHDRRSFSDPTRKTRNWKLVSPETCYRKK